MEITLPERYQATGEEIDGGCSKILIFRDTHLDRNVAVKVMTSLPDESRMIDEVHSLLNIRSKHVVEVYDFIEYKNGFHALILEYLEGDTLFPNDTIYTIDSFRSGLLLLWQIACGISDIHESNVIHRDIKPQNIIIDSESIAKIYDFGLSRNSVDDAQTVGFRGTFVFSAPELFVASDEAVEFSSAVDVYSFGVIAAFLFRQEFPAELQQIPLQHKPSNLYQNTEISAYPELNELLLSCIDLNPENRPSIDEIKLTLESYLLKDKHRAMVVLPSVGKQHFLNKDRRGVKIAFDTLGALVIVYTGFHFEIKDIEGDVYVNNDTPANGDKLPVSSVITIGAPEKGSQRKFLTFDVFNPEITV